MTSAEEAGPGHHPVADNCRITRNHHMTWDDEDDPGNPIKETDGVVVTPFTVSKCVAIIVRDKLLTSAARRNAESEDKPCPLPSESSDQVTRRDRVDFHVFDQPVAVKAKRQRFSIRSKVSSCPSSPLPMYVSRVPDTLYVESPGGTDTPGDHD